MVWAYVEDIDRYNKQIFRSNTLGKSLWIKVKNPKTFGIGVHFPCGEVKNILEIKHLFFREFCLVFPGSRIYCIPLTESLFYVGTSAELLFPIGPLHF